MTYLSHAASKARSKARSRAQASTAGQLDARLDELIDIAQDMSPAWPAVAAVWAKREQQIFASDSNGRWAPLKPSTIKKKQREGAPLDTLRDTGMLLRELTSDVPRASAPHYVVLGPHKGAAIEFAKYHARGMGVPQRHPVPRFTPTETRRLVDAIREQMGMGT